MARNRGAGYKPGDNEEETTQPGEPDEEQDETGGDETADASSQEESADEEEEEDDAEEAPPVHVAPKVRTKAAPAAETGQTGTAAPQIEVLHLGDAHFQHGAEAFTGTVHFDVSTEGGKFKYDELKAAKARRDARMARLMEQHKAEGIYNPTHAPVHYTIENPVT